MSFSHRMTSGCWDNGDAAEQKQRGEAPVVDSVCGTHQTSAAGRRPQAQRAHGDHSVEDALRRNAIYCPPGQREQRGAEHGSAGTGRDKRAVAAQVSAD